MNSIKHIQSEIMKLEGGAFQTLFDAYLYKRFKFKNIQTLGVQTGTNKPTKGIPDSYVLTEDGKYILINYGSVSSNPVKKIKDDILACLNAEKLSISRDKIAKIICGYTSTNISLDQFDDIIKEHKDINIELIGIDTLSHDLALRYPHIAKEQLGIAIDTNQFFDIEDFVRVYDANGINAPIDCRFLHRQEEIKKICKSINANVVTILTGPSGIGKTRLALETCRILDKDDLSVYCIKNNGNLLYDDMKYYIDVAGNYLLFFDDANMVPSLDNVLNAISTLPEGYNVKVLITVRDYAKDRVIKSVSKYFNYSIVEIGKFNDSDIKDVLQVNFGIKNPDYLKEIVKIANGNVRLACLAGIRSVRSGYQAIHNVEDIFKNYYGHIINEVNLAKEDILILFFIVVSGPVKKTHNQLYESLKQKYYNEHNENEIIEKLYSFELIDWFKKEIIKISDQSFGNYILYLVLFENKWVEVEDLVLSFFPAYRNKIVYVLRTLIEIFYSDQMLEYVKASTISAWNKAPFDQQMQYVESFYVFDPDKALSIIKKHVDKEEKVEIDLKNFDIKSKANHYHLPNVEIEILCGYKYIDCFEDAVDLLIIYFTKRPDLIIDFYNAFCSKMLYDKCSCENDYKKEALLLQKLWSSTNYGKNYNNSILYLCVAEYALRTYTEYTEQNINGCSFDFMRMPLVFTEGMAAIRNEIWKNLGILRKSENYYAKVNKILLEANLNGLGVEATKKVFEVDFNSVFELVISKDNPNFDDARIIDSYEGLAKQIGVRFDDRFKIAMKNKKFSVYKMLTGDRKFDETWEEFQKRHRKCLFKKISSYKISDYKELFNICDFLGKKEDVTNLWDLNAGLELVFEILEDNDSSYVDIISEYLNANAPLRLNRYRQINRMLEIIGYDGTYKLVNSKKFDKKNEWLSSIWQCLENDRITDKVVEDYKKFVLDNINGDNPVVPTFQMLNIYGERDLELKVKVIKAVSDSPRFSIIFLGDEFKDDVYEVVLHEFADGDVEVILNIFRDDIKALSNIYMNILKEGRRFDLGGKLFKRIFEHRELMWNDYVEYIEENSYRDLYKKEIIEFIWGTENWKACVEYAYKLLIDDNVYYDVEEQGRLLFEKSRNGFIMNRKKNWLFEKMKETSEDITKCKNIIDIIVTVLPEWKLEFILEFINKNSDSEAFKKINLFPSTRYGSGSEVPFIFDEIKFLKMLKDNLKGIDFIEHRAYLEERCRSLNKYREKLELMEYLENADYA